MWCDLHGRTLPTLNFPKETDVLQLKCCSVLLQHKFYQQETTATTEWFCFDFTHFFSFQECIVGFAEFPIHSYISAVWIVKHETHFSFQVLQLWMQNSIWLWIRQPIRVLLWWWDLMDLKMLLVSWTFFERKLICQMYCNLHKICSGKHKVP